MTDVAPPAPPTPKEGGRALKGKFSGQPKWVYIAAFGVFLGVAFLAWKRSQANAAAAAAAPTDPQTNYSGTSPDQSAFDYGPVTYPTQTQGAFGGNDSPMPTDPSLSPVGPWAMYPWPDPTGWMTGDRFPGTGPLPQPDAVPAAATPSPTGGGPPNSTGPKTVPAAAPKPSGAAIPMACPTSHPFADQSYKPAPWGCYRVVTSGKERWHYHYDGRKVRVS